VVEQLLPETRYALSQAPQAQQLTPSVNRCRSTIGASLSRRPHLCRLSAGGAWWTSSGAPVAAGNQSGPRGWGSW